ncbi:MAG: response regulator [Candidatus Aegiribacteria sp.]|nr:response regulator [Candidatus Aegiribacteria sp.]
MQRLEGLGTIAGGIAHDFNNLLTGIFTNIEMAKLDLTENSSSSSYLKDACDAIHSARQLTGQLLTFAKGSAPVLDTVETSVLVRDTVDFNLHGSNIIPEFILQDGLWPIKADKGQIGQVLANLIINAKQVMPCGGTLHIEGRNVLGEESIDSPDPAARYVCLTIRDEGTGIPSKIIEHIFDPYFSTKDAGPGLGLAIAHSIVEQHSGSISVSSLPNVSATFTIILPAIPLSELEGVEKTSRKNTASKDVPSLHVLLMDDEEILRKVGKQMIEHLGHTVDTAADGDEALHKYKAAMESGKPFDLVVMDLTIRGGKGGEATISELLEIDSLARVIVSSGFTSGPVMADYSSYGFSGKLAKPFMMKDLKQEINRIMEKKFN